MSDREERELERRVASGDEGAAEALARARCRRGQHTVEWGHELRSLNPFGPPRGPAMEVGRVWGSCRACGTGAPRLVQQRLVVWNPTMPGTLLPGDRLVLGTFVNPELAGALERISPSDPRAAQFLALERRSWLGEFAMTSYGPSLAGLVPSGQVIHVAWLHPDPWAVARDRGGLREGFAHHWYEPDGTPSWLMAPLERAKACP